MKLHFIPTLMLFAPGLFAATVFNASGTFADGTQLGGTVTIDTVAGTITAIDLTFSGPISGTLTVAQGTGGGSAYVDFGAGTPSGFPSMSVVAPGSTFVGYSGGALCGTAAPCGVVSGLWASSSASAVRLTSGSLTAGSGPPGTPAPPSVWLAVVGCMAVLGYGLLSRCHNYA